MRFTMLTAGAVLNLAVAATCSAAEPGWPSMAAALAKGLREALDHIAIRRS